MDETAATPPPSPPLRNCDVVMKGGITSGIVYPQALQELSNRYRFRSIGGTSAGAIAAAATAAAEVGRRRGNAASFDALARLPKLLSDPVREGGPSRLFSLFQPQAATSAVYKTLVAGLGEGCKGWRILRAAIRNFLPAAIAAFLFCGLIAAAWTAFNVSRGGWGVGVAGLVPAALLTLLAVLAAVAFSLVRRATRRIPENLYGLCTGYADPPSAAEGPEPPLTTWLHKLINGLAGQPPDRPLTFGDLWWPDGKRPDVLPEAEPPDASVRLQMMTTNLTHGRPYRLPFLGREERMFLYDPKEFARLFPPDVMKWMAEHAREEKEEHRGDGYLPLPRAADLPVIVAARMSLSFPFLISAVPLYAIDYSRPKEKQKPERCWFSDGGIASNFPVHFFDGPLPRWPTFAINLRPYHRDHPERHVHKARGNRGGIEEWWWTIDRGSGLSRLLGFWNAVSNAMQNWGDNALLKLPGYRDRVVHVSLADEEGGMNLDMPAGRITKLGERGRDAARMLADDFEGKPGPGGEVPELTWDNHRWVRFRTLMGLFEGEFGRIGLALAHREPGERSWEELILRQDESPPGSYSLASDRRRKAAEEAVRALAALATAWESTVDFTKEAPKPESELRVRPRI